MPKARLIFDGDNIYTEKDARVYKLKNDISSKIDGIPGVVDSLDSISSTDALSANMGRTLQDQINSLSGTGKFLSTWDCTTGLPGTNPQEDPYTYKVGDYYVVSVTGATNYRPHGGTYTQGVPSTAVELENVGINDKYYFDGANWVRIPDTAIQIGIDSTLSTTSTNAVENRAIATAVNGKQDIITDLSTIRAGATAGATALQKLDNISELTNNIGYQTAGDVNSAIQSAIGQLPTVNDGVLTIQKNSTTIDTFSANSASNKTINIGVPTTVAELSDASDYATKTYVDGAIDGLIHEGGTAPQNPHEGDLWYDTVNHVLKIYNGTTWETVDTDTNTTYTAGNGINIDANNEISIDTTVVATTTYADTAAGNVISDTAYGSSWDGDTTHAPSKNSVYDEVNIIEGNMSTIQGDITNLGTNKQDTLVSGTNIKTINNESLLGSGNITINPGTSYNAGPGISIGDYSDYSAMRGPCTEGYHIPLKDEWNDLLGILTNTFSLTGNEAMVGTYLKMPKAGFRDATTSSSFSLDYAGNYWSAISSDSFAYTFSFYPGTFSVGLGYQKYAYSIRPFKNSPVIPDSTWTTLYDGSSVAIGAGIFYNATLGLISISGDGTNWITITDKNLGATVVYNSGDTLSENNCGYLYQWGNNYGFSYNGDVATSSTSVDASDYGPGNYYSSSTFIKGSGAWSNPVNGNLWGGVTGGTTIQNAITNTGVLSINGQSGNVNISASTSNWVDGNSLGSHAFSGPESVSIPTGTKLIYFKAQNENMDNYTPALLRLSDMLYKTTILYVGGSINGSFVASPTSLTFLTSTIGIWFTVEFY